MNYITKNKGNKEENKVEASSWIPIHSIILESENGEDVKILLQRNYQ